MPDIEGVEYMHFGEWLAQHEEGRQGGLREALRVGYFVSEEIINDDVNETIRAFRQYGLRSEVFIGDPSHMVLMQVVASVLDNPGRPTHGAL